MKLLRQSTLAIKKVGPFMDVDGNLLNELSIARGDILLSKEGGEYAQKGHNSGALVDGTTGNYAVTLGSQDTDTCGTLQMLIAKSGAVPVQIEWTVVPQPVYDSLIVGTGWLDQLALLVGKTMPYLAVGNAVIDTFPMAGIWTAAGFYNGQPYFCGGQVTGDSPYYLWWDGFIWIVSGSPGLKTNYLSGDSGFSYRDPANVPFTANGSGASGTLTFYHCPALRDRSGNLPGVSVKQWNDASNSVLPAVFGLTSPPVTGFLAMRGDEQLLPSASLVAAAVAAQADIASAIAAVDLLAARFCGTEGKVVLDLAEETLKVYAADNATVIYQQAYTVTPVKQTFEAATT